MAAVNEQTIEVEVVEIDGVAVEQRPAREETRHRGERIEWSLWQGRAKRLDARWWPLWFVLGSVALVAAVAVGLCFAVLFVSWRILKSILHGLANLFSPTR